MCGGMYPRLEGQTYAHSDTVLWVRGMQADSVLVAGIQILLIVMYVQMLGKTAALAYLQCWSICNGCWFGFALVHFP